MAAGKEIRRNMNPSKKHVVDLPSALDSVREIKEQAMEKRVALFLDYDGTLTPIVERPEQAILSDVMRQTVIELAKHCTVAVLSGRDLKDVQQLVGIHDIVFAGSHGFDIAGPRDWRLQSQQGNDFLPVLDTAEQELHDRLDNVRGALIERKKFTIAVHLRQVEEKDQGLVEQTVDQVLMAHPELRKGYGKKVYELQPKTDWHKGKALLWLLEALELDSSDVLPIYIGDDVTDEDAFETIYDRGIGIFVQGHDGPEQTAAHYALEDTEDVRIFMETLIEILKSK